jgi:hypothetical protein
MTTTSVDKQTAKVASLGFDDAGTLFEKVGNVAGDFMKEYGTVTELKPTEFSKIVEFSRDLYTSVIDFLKISGAEVRLDATEIGSFMKKTTLAMNDFMTLDTDGDGGAGERTANERISEFNDSIFNAAIDLVEDAGDEEPAKEPAKTHVAPTSKNMNSETSNLTNALAGLDDSMNKNAQIANSPMGINQAIGGIADQLLAPMAG